MSWRTYIALLSAIALAIIMVITLADITISGSGYIVEPNRAMGIIEIIVLLAITGLVVERLINLRKSRGR